MTEDADPAEDERWRSRPRTYYAAFLLGQTLMPAMNGLLRGSSRTGPASCRDSFRPLPIEGRDEWLAAARRLA